MFKPSIAKSARVQEQTLIFLNIYIIQLVIRWRPRINQTSLWMSLSSRIMRNVFRKNVPQAILATMSKSIHYMNGFICEKTTPVFFHYCHRIDSLFHGQEYKNHIKCRMPMIKAYIHDYDKGLYSSNIS